MKILFESCIDEFNSLMAPSFGKKFLQKENEFYAITEKNFDVLFHEFDKVLVFDFDKDISIINYFNEFPEQREIFLKKITKQSIKTLGTSNLEVISERFMINNLYKESHIYEFVFSNTARMFLENNISFINPKENDYLKIKEKLAGINSKIVCINGRNLNKHEFRNNKFEKLIEKLVKDDFYVINTTLYPPKFDFPKKSYLEIDNCLSYSENISYFLNSDCVISIADSGGVNVHLLTKSNFLLLGRGGWIDNPQFGFMGKDVVSARKMNQEIKTDYIFDETNFKYIEKFINSCSKPIVDNFFDETKIIKITDK
jgi:hypothetical protein